MNKKVITLQTAKSYVRKAIKILNFVKEKNLPIKAYPENAYYKVKGQLSLSDADNFSKWFSNLKY